MRQTATSDEEIIAALLQSGTIREAADTLNIAPRTIYDRMKSKDFRGLYSEAKTGIMRKAVFSVNERLGAAVDTVAEIMEDRNVNAATRLQAAQTIISNAGKLSKWLQEDESQTRTEASGIFDF